MLIGKQGAAKLANSRVAIFGLGGVGSHAAEALARAGVGYLELIDGDVVAPSNINRQLPALHSTIGQPKVQVLRQRFLDINPQVQIVARQEFYRPENGASFIHKDLDYVIDAIDTVPSKVDLIARCLEANVPIISSMGAGNRLDPGAFRVADISATSVCPLAKAVRRGLRLKGIEKGVEVVFSLEPPLRPCQVCGDPYQGKQVPGSISFVPAVAGYLMAGVVIRRLLGYSG
ncbi:MAG: tRNA threonylcarbamoyladenosine dehydratase [Clostridia bacterium]|nr:tRNA threonylcarbamoyladenosine dehydratase [Clostridia bacterium]